MARALSSSGAENTREMNVPLESKYWCLENNLSQEEFECRHRRHSRDFLYLTESQQAHLSLGAGWPLWDRQDPHSHTTQDPGRSR